MTQQELIIEKPHLQSASQRLGYNTLTIFFWMVWAYLWLPLISLGLWAVGVAGFVSQVILPGNPAELSEVGRFFAVGVVLIAATLIGWAKYNQYRFGGHQRRREMPVTQDRELEAFFAVDTDTLARVRHEKSITIHFEDRVMRVLLTTDFIDGLKPARADYAIADINVSGLRIWVCANGDKIYQCRLSESELVVLGSVQSLTLDEARERARDQMHRYFATGVNISDDARRCTLGEFIYAYAGKFAGESYIVEGDEIIDWRASISRLHDLKLSQISEQDVCAWQAEILGTGASAADIRYCTEMLRATLIKAVQRRFIAESPLRHLPAYHLNWAPNRHHDDQELSA